MVATFWIIYCSKGSVRLKSGTFLKAFAFYTALQKVYGYTIAFGWVLITPFDFPFGLTLAPLLFGLVLGLAFGLAFAGYPVVSA